MIASRAYFLDRVGSEAVHQLVETGVLVPRQHQGDRHLGADAGSQITQPVIVFGAPPSLRARAPMVSGRSSPGKTRSWMPATALRRLATSSPRWPTRSLMAAFSPSGTCCTR